MGDFETGLYCQHIMFGAVPINREEGFAMMGELDLRVVVFFFIGVVFI
jgi:hypothetical protein